jgi:hypothetical protein
MKIKKEKWDTLDGVLDKIWLMLNRLASDDRFWKASDCLLIHFIANDRTPL